MPIPNTVPEEHHNLYTLANEVRAQIKAIAADVVRLKGEAVDVAARRHLPPGDLSIPAVDPEVIANATLAYRHLEDASMRLGKVLQALDGGVSVYGKATTVGAPEA